MIQDEVGQRKRTLRGTWSGSKDGPVGGTKRERSEITLPSSFRLSYIPAFVGVFPCICVEGDISLAPLMDFAILAIGVEIIDVTLERDLLLLLTSG